jgi:hypothetical protein
MTLKERLDAGLEHLKSQGAKPVRIVLTEADALELRKLADAGGAYGGIPVEQGQIGGHSYIEAEGAPSGDTNFAI